MNKSALIVLAVLSLSLAPMASGQARQETVAHRGAAVMPFDLNATIHLFTKTETGGTQQVNVKNAADAAQLSLVRAHMKEIAGHFSKGDFSAPTRIHGPGMPGLAELKKAQPAQIAVRYQETGSGAMITYTSTHAALVAALHRWFDAQLSDHGSHAMEGHDHSTMRH